VAVPDVEIGHADPVSIIVTVKIYTKTGDSGETGLFDGTRVAKSDPRVAPTATWTS
jgi:cob(I)alamin adenosyltransferase